MLTDKYDDSASVRPTSRGGQIGKALAWVGIAMALPFFVWAVVGLIPAVPSMVDVFGIPGLRTPASIVIGGLLLAAIGLRDF